MRCSASAPRCTRRTTSSGWTTGAAKHNLQFGGHTDQEEPANPTPLTGDLIKMFKYQTIPTIDDIWWYGRSNVSYKIVTSSGFNYDHRIIRAETYAAYRGLTDKIAFQVAMDQYAMGINSQVTGAHGAAEARGVE